GFSVLLLAGGRPRAFVKVRFRQREAVERECLTMERLARYRPQSFSVPEPLGWGGTEDWSYLAMGALPSPRHQVPRDPPLRAIVHEVAAALRTLVREPSTPPHWRPMHGDLTPWNLRE